MSVVAAEVYDEWYKKWRHSAETEIKRKQGIPKIKGYSNKTIQYRQL